MTGAHQSHRHILITGASSGLGSALADRQASAGVTLSLSGRNRERLEKVAETCSGKGANVEIAILDVTDGKGMAEWLTERDEALPLDIVYANAGIGGSASLAGLTGEDPDAARRIFEVNTMGVVNTVAPLVPRLHARKRGHFVIVSSMASLIALPHSPAYCGSKAAVTAYGESLRRLLAPAGVKVTLVHPGYVDTPMSATLPFERPLLWTAERAAAHIVEGVARGRARIDFPRRFTVALQAARFLPKRLVDAVLARSMKTVR